MEKETLEKLIIGLNEIKIKQIELYSQKNKKNKDNLDSIIAILKNNLISKFELMNFDLHIKMESHKTDFFIDDVEDIISKLKNK